MNPKENIEMKEQERILIAEDDANDAFFIQNALKLSGVQCKPHVCANAPEAIQYLEGAGCYADRSQFPFPNLLITDLKMPGGGGFELLQWLRDHPTYLVIPIIVLSSSALQADVMRAYCMGANAYIQKPVDPARFRQVFTDLLRFWAHCEVPETPASKEALELYPQM